MLSTAADGGYGSHVGVEQTYDGTGAELASAALMGYAGAGQALTPEVTALPYGYYQVSYAGSNDLEVYNAADQPVLERNAYTSQTTSITPLAGGGYVQTDPSWAGVFAVFDANNNAVAWDSYAAGSPGAPAVHALPDGDFVFTYAGSREIEAYDASGHLLNTNSWGSPVQDFAMGFAPIGQSGFLGAWIGTDFTSGPNAGQTAVLIEPFFNDGGTITRTIVLADDLDPWNTQFNLQSHADGSVAVLWSRGGAAFGAEYGANGVPTAYSTGVAEALSAMDVIQLPGDKVGLAWLQGGDAWAEIFDPATGAVQRVDLGAAAGDLSTVHALATAAGGVAVSWHAALGIEGAVLGADGTLGAPLALPGDLLGVDSHGHALTLHDSGGTPVLQAYALNDGLFWAA